MTDESVFINSEMDEWIEKVLRELSERRYTHAVIVMFDREDTGEDDENYEVAVDYFDCSTDELSRAIGYLEYTRMKEWQLMDEEEEANGV